MATAGKNLSAFDPIQFQNWQTKSKRCGPAHQTTADVAWLGKCAQKHAKICAKYHICVKYAQGLEYAQNM
jgi:hypothetical protein